MQPAPQVGRKIYTTRHWSLRSNDEEFICTLIYTNTRAEETYWIDQNSGVMERCKNRAISATWKKTIVSLGRHQDFSRNNFLDSACIAILSNLRRKFVKLQFQYQYQWNNLNSLLVDPQYFKIVWTVWTTNTSSYLLDSDNIMAIISYGWLLAGRHIACWAIWHLLDIVAYAMHRPMWPLLFLHLLE